MIRTASLAAQTLSLCSKSGDGRRNILAAAQSLFCGSERRGRAYLGSFTVALSLFPFFSLALIHKLLSFFVSLADFVVLQYIWAFFLLSVPRTFFFTSFPDFLSRLLLIPRCIDSLCVYSQNIFIWPVKLKLTKIHMLIHQFVKDYSWFQSKSEEARLGLPMKNI